MTRFSLVASCNIYSLGNLTTKFTCGKFVIPDKIVGIVWFGPQNDESRSLDLLTESDVSMGPGLKTNRLLLFLQVSQGDATEKLAHQVAAQVAAVNCWVEEASGDPHEEEKDETHKSSKGHVSEPAARCPTSPESFMSNMEDNEKTKLCDGSLMTQRTEVQPSDGVYVPPQTFSSNLQDFNDSAFFTMNPNQLWPDVASRSSSLP